VLDGDTHMHTQPQPASSAFSGSFGSVFVTSFLSFPLFRTTACVCVRAFVHVFVCDIGCVVLIVFCLGVVCCVELLYVL